METQGHQAPAQGRSGSIILSRAVGAGLALVIGTLINFLFVRVGFLAFTATDVVDQVTGVANDCLVASCLFLSVLPLLLLLQGTVRREAIARWATVGFIAGVSLIVATVTWVGFFYYLFSGGYLSLFLVMDYLPQLGFLMDSIRSEDFDLQLLAVAVGVWLAVVAVTWRWALPRLGTPRRRVLTVAVLLGGAAVSLVGPDPSRGVRANVIYHLAASRTPIDLGATDHWETRFDRCLDARFERVDPAHPFIKRRRQDPGIEPLVSIPDQRPDVVFVFMESYSEWFLDRNGRNDRPITPALERIIDRGWFFSRFYANGTQTTRGEFAALCSVYPNFGPQISTDYPDLRLRCLPHLLAEHGYQTEYLQVVDLDFDNKRRSFPAMGFDRLAGEGELPEAAQRGPRAGWGLADEVLFDHAVDLLDAGRDSPQLLVLMTVTHHHPFEVPRPEFEIYPPTSQENRFRNSLHYSDWALGRFIDDLAARGLDRNTVVVVTADTSSPMKQHEDNVMLINHAFEENYRVPLVLHAPDFIDAPREISELVSQVDVLPMMVDLFGIAPAEDGFMGQDMLAEDACRFVLLPQSFGRGYLAMRYGDLKIIYDMTAETMTAFDLLGDPEERRPLLFYDRILGAEMKSFAARVFSESSAAIHANSIYPW